MHKRIEIKKIIERLSICITLLVLIWFFFVLIQGRLKERDRIKYLKPDDFSFVFQVDSIENDGKKVLLEGWAFKLGMDSLGNDINILLYDLEKKIIYPKMKYTVRKDVNEYFLCEYDYSNSGFVASFSLNKLDIVNKDYEILVGDKNNEEIYHTGTYMVKGKLMYTNPKTFEKLNVMGTELEKIVNNGVLRLYRSDVGMYVYQYERNLYWIAEQKYKYWGENKDTSLQFILDTTQPLKLPKERVEAGYTSDDRGFAFSSCENYGLCTEKYRVASCELPEEYSVTALGTGFWRSGEGWLWNNNFRPFYELN